MEKEKQTHTVLGPRLRACALVLPLKVLGSFCVNMQGVNEEGQRSRCSATEGSGS